MTRRSLVVPIGILAGLLAAAPALAGIVVEELPLADGRRGVIHDGTLYLPDHAGLLKVAPDGRYALEGGGEVTVRARKRLLSPRFEKEFDPQPEPPGLELRGVLADGRKVTLVRNQLLLREEGGRRCPDGAYRLQGGARLHVVGGQVTSLSSLEGLALPGTAEAQR